MEEASPHPDPIASRAVRLATQSDAASIAQLVNQAFVVEKSFVTGDRTTEEEVRELLEDGQFLVLDRPGGSLVASIYVRVAEHAARFGLLAVAPEMQGKGLGKRLVAVAEHLARAEGCRVMELQVVNLREELPPFYQSLGYTATGTAPFPEEPPPKKPCHFIRMAKPLSRI